MSERSHNSNHPHRTLDALERIGNRLPDPVALFFIGLLVVIVLSHLASVLEWSVINTADQSNGAIAKPIVAKSLLNSEGIWWLLSHLVHNFINFPPLGIVLVGMLGIGLADRSGFLPVALRMASMRVQGMWLTPAMIFLGIMSSIALDAGYVVLPPIAAVLFILSNRSPVVGIAAVFAGVSAGFGANLFITSLDPLLAGFSQAGAQVLDHDYQIAVTCNWWFMIASTLLLTTVGWLVTARYVEPRFGTLSTSRLTLNDSLEKTTETNSAYKQYYGATINNVTEKEKSAVLFAILSLIFLIGIILVFSMLPNAPLYGKGEHFPRWVEATVPLLFIIFLIPGIVYGVTVGTIESHRDVARMMGDTFASLGPYIVLAFFAAQFIEAFKYSHLGEMLAIGGGQWLASINISVYFLIAVFILIVMTGNIFIGSMSAKYAFFAPVFVPIFMQLGVSPELTQVAYRIGDSVTNVITPLNPYLIIVLALLKEYLPKSGLGTLISIMLPYTIAFSITWTLFLFAWMLLGIPLGPSGPLYITQ